MKTQRFVIFALLMMIFSPSAEISFAQEQDIQFSARPAEKYKVASITWKGHFGGRKEEPYNIYILMSRGGFRAPTSEDYENLIEAWLAKHLHAEVTVVYTLDGAMAQFPDSKMKWVWVVEGDENLNIYLVRRGGCPAGTMFLGSGDKTHVAREEYESFVKKVIEAESLAKKERLGIWSEKKK